MSTELPKTNIFGEPIKEADPNKPKECYFCHTPCTDDQYCFGCGEYVCLNCNHFEGMGNHDVEDHKGNDDLGEDGWEEDSNEEGF